MTLTALAILIIVIGFPDSDALIGKQLPDLGFRLLFRESLDLGIDGFEQFLAVGCLPGFVEVRILFCLIVGQRFGNRI